MSKKYELTNESIEFFGKTLFRIRAIRSLGLRVKAGDLGGFIEKESNLSHDGDCWVDEEAKVYGDAQVSEDALVQENAEVYDFAQISGSSYVYGKARVFDSAHVYGNSYVFGNAKVFGSSQVFDIARVQDDAEVFGTARIFDDMVVDGDMQVEGPNWSEHPDWTDNQIRQKKLDKALNTQRITSITISDATHQEIPHTINTDLELLKRLKGYLHGQG